MSASRFHAVIETQADGTIVLWGPFTPHRADLAVAALQELDGVEHARALPLLNSSVLSSALPDWTRGVA